MDTEGSTMQHELKRSKGCRVWIMGVLRAGKGEWWGKSGENGRGSFNAKIYSEIERKCPFVP